MKVYNNGYRLFVFTAQEIDILTELFNCANDYCYGGGIGIFTHEKCQNCPFADTIFCTEGLSQTHVKGREKQIKYNSLLIYFDSEDDEQ